MVAGGAAHFRGPAAREPRSVPARRIRQQHGLGRCPPRASRAQRPAPQAVSGHRPGPARKPRRRPGHDDPDRDGRAPAAARVRSPSQTRPRPLDRQRRRLRAARHRSALAGAHRLDPGSARRPRTGAGARPAGAAGGAAHRPRAGLPAHGVRRRPEDDSRPHPSVRCAFGRQVARLARGDRPPVRPPVDGPSRGRGPRCSPRDAAGGHLSDDRRVHRGNCSAR